MSERSVSMYDKITDPISAIQTFGKMFEESNLFGISKGQGSIIAMACILEKKNPLEIVRTYHIINNKLVMKSDAMLSEVRKIGGSFKWIHTADDGKKATLFIEYKGNSGEITFTIGDAERAGLVKPGNNWHKYPSAMLRARCISAAVRAFVPEVNHGVYSPEEINDINDENDPKLLDKKEPKFDKQKLIKPKEEKAVEPEKIENKDPEKVEEFVFEDNKGNGINIKPTTLVEKEPAQIVEVVNDQSKLQEQVVGVVETAKSNIASKESVEQGSERDKLINKVKEMFTGKIDALNGLLRSKNSIEANQTINDLTDIKLNTIIGAFKTYMKHVDMYIEKNGVK